MKQKILYSLIALAVAGVSTSASASTITNQDLTNATPFGGFDWSQNGTAVTTPGPTYVNGQNITAFYFADAVAINKTGGGTFFTPNLVNGAPGGAFGSGQYEYTVVATIFETVSGCGPNPGDPCTGTAQFTPTGGTFNIYYDFAGLAGGNTIADQIAGTGFTDGAVLLSGNIVAGGGGTFDPITNSSGTFSFSGQVTTTNATYITPDQTHTFALATLQFGNAVTNWTASTATPFGALPGSNLQFQADGNQSFQVPEPGSLALLGLGMLGLFATQRKRNLSN